MPLSLLNHSAPALFAQRTRIPTSARSTGFCAIWVCISSSSSSPPNLEPRLRAPQATGRPGVSSAGTGRPHQIWSFSYGPGGWACCLDTHPMGGWASISFFCSGRAGGRRKPGGGPVGGPAKRTNRTNRTKRTKRTLTGLGF